MVQIFATRGSGNGRALGLARRLRAALEARGWRTRLDDFADVRRLARWPRPPGAPLPPIVGVGGDGTMSPAARGARPPQIPFVPVPGGFGNLFARPLRHRR